MHRHHHHHLKKNPHDQQRHATLSGRRSGRGIDITVLGGFRVAVDGTPTSDHGWSRRSAAALVKILALAPGHRLHREKVMDLLWPDESPGRTAPRLHKAAHFARRAAGRDDAVVLRDDVVWLFPHDEVTVDAVRFEQLARAAVASGDPTLAGEALGGYGGELLPADIYEEWTINRRELLHLRRLDLLRLVGDWRELTELDPTDEDGHVRLMHSHIANGDGAAAIRQYEHLERVLSRELGSEPGEAARQARLEASLMGWRDEVGATSRVDSLLAELADLEQRQNALLAELAAVGGVPR